MNISKEVKSHAEVFRQTNQVWRKDDSLQEIFERFIQGAVNTETFKLTQALKDIHACLAPQPGYGLTREQQHQNQNKAVIKAYDIATDALK